MATSERSVGVAYALMLFTLIGICGVQHFYMGKIFRGLLWFFTFGLLGIGLIIDLFTLPRQVRNS
jgi:TM2 domain-containing membrane protein YozV